MQDAEAAQQPCNSLRAAGIEVWFDQNELRGGDTWDELIRRQIKGCYLFVPMISANTQSREEYGPTAVVQRGNAVLRKLPFVGTRGEAGLSYIIQDGGLLLAAIASPKIGVVSALG